MVVETWAVVVGWMMHVGERMLFKGLKPAFWAVVYVGEEGVRMQEGGRVVRRSEQTEDAGDVVRAVAGGGRTASTALVVDEAGVTIAVKAAADIVANWGMRRICFPPISQFHSKKDIACLYIRSTPTSTRHTGARGALPYHHPEDQPYSPPPPHKATFHPSYPNLTPTTHSRNPLETLWKHY